jgi:hypothetical protein
MTVQGVSSEMATPPELSISLSLATETSTQEEQSAANSKISVPAIQITITNKDDRTITMKTKGHQPYRHARGQYINPYARVTAKNPDIKSFSIVDLETQEEINEETLLFISPLRGGSGGWSRKGFLTLTPQESVTRTAILRNHRLIAGREYRISLRDVGCWWMEGTLDDMFGESNAVLRSWPLGRTAPMFLKSEDVLTFRY